MDVNDALRLHLPVQEAFAISSVVTGRLADDDREWDVARSAHVMIVSAIALPALSDLISVPSRAVVRSAPPSDDCGWDGIPTVQ